MSTLNNFVEKIKRISIELLEKLKIFIQTTTGRRVLIGLAAISTITIVIAAIFTGDSSKDKDSRVEAVAQATTTEVANEEITETETTTQTLETTIVEETTEKETTAIEVIDVGNLDISNEDLSTREELNRNNVDTQEQEINYVQLSYDSVTSPSSISKNSHLVYGIDVSKWQGDIDWAKVKAAGYDFAMIRCGGRSIASYASLYIDERFKENVEGALANGIQVGVYFFSQALSEREAQEEASLVLQLIKDYQITYPVAFDWETAAGYRTYNANISTSKFTNIVDTFCIMIQQAGYEPMVYGNYGDLYRFDVETLSKKYKIWYARWYSRYEYTSAKYVEGESVPNLNFSYQMWQYKSTGRVPGISENVDMNVAFIPYLVEDTSNDTLELSIKNKEITINTGEKINLLDGVTAKYISGADVSAAVTYEIKNSDGTSINDDIAFDTPGNIHNYICGKR